MRNTLLIAAALVLAAAAHSCRTATKAPARTTFHYEDLYRVWVVDTILLNGTAPLTTPNIEMDKNEYQFTKRGGKKGQGTRTTITTGATFAVDFTLKDGIIHFNPAATFPITRFDENGQLVSSNFFATLPPYQITELTPDRLTLRNPDLVMKLKAK